MTDLGRAKTVTINRDFTTIVEGGGSQAEIEARIKTLRSDQAASPYDREKLFERIARLVGGVAVVRVGGMSENEVLDKKYRGESAMHSTRSAIEEGWVPGGGTAFYYAADTLSTVLGGNEAESAGIMVVAEALRVPITCLIENAQTSTTQTLHKISQVEDRRLGFNVETKEIENLVGSGVIDSTKMLRVCLELAYAYAKSVLETEEWDLEDPKPFVPATA